MAVVKKCPICGREFIHKNLRGAQYYPPTCSAKCFVAYLEAQGYGPRYYNLERYPITRAFCSKLEQSVYGLLAPHTPVEHEPYVIRLKKHVYVPDFFLPSYGVFVEVKGIWDRAGKFFSAAKEFPLFLVDKQIEALWRKNSKNSPKTRN